MSRENQSKPSFKGLRRWSFDSQKFIHRVLFSVREESLGSPKQFDFHIESVVFTSETGTCDC